MTRRISHTLAFVSVIFAALALAGCQHNPIAAAETPAQHAFAISATYNVLLESAADIVEDTTAPTELRRAVQQTELRTTPVIDALEQAFADYQLARAQFAAGATTADRLEVATVNLEQWLERAEYALVELADAFRDE